MTHFYLASYIQMLLSLKYHHQNRRILGETSQKQSKILFNFISQKHLSSPQQSINIFFMARKIPIKPNGIISKKNISTKSKKVLNKKLLKKKNPARKTKLIAKKSVASQSNKKMSQRKEIQKLTLKQIPIIFRKKQLRSSDPFKNINLKKDTKSKNTKSKSIKNRGSMKKPSAESQIQQFTSNPLKNKSNLKVTKILNKNNSKINTDTKYQKKNSSRKDSRSKSKNISKRKLKTMEIQKSTSKNKKSLKQPNKFEKAQKTPLVSDKLKRKKQNGTKSKNSQSSSERLKMPDFMLQTTTLGLANEETSVIKEQLQTENILKCIQELKDVNISKFEKFTLISSKKNEQSWSFKIMEGKGSLFDMTINEKVSCSCLGSKIKHYCKHIEYVITKIAKLDEADLFQSQSSLKLSAYDKLDKALSERLSLIISAKDVKQKVNNHEKRQTDFECKMCFNKINEDSKKLENCSNCNNKFHEDCVTTWKQINLICPVCKELLNQAQPDIHPLDNEQLGL